MEFRASYHQERLWRIDKSETGTLYETGPVYHNIPLIFRIRGDIDTILLEKSIKAVIRRHEALKTRFTTKNGTFVQTVEKEAAFKLETLDLTGYPGENREKRAVDLAIEFAKQPFKLDTEFPSRAKLIQFSGDGVILVISIHHIIADRYSLKIITGEIFAHYDAFRNGKAPVLPALSAHYVDFSQWQYGFSDEVLEPMLFYWRRKLKGNLQPLELPSDKPGTERRTFHDGNRRFKIDKDSFAKIENFCSQNKTSKSLVLLAVFKILLYRYSGQKEIIVGMSEENRNQPGLEHIVGPIATLLVLRSFLDEKSHFLKVLEDLKKTVGEARKYKDIPFERLDRELPPPAGINRDGLFNVLFQYEEKGEDAISPDSLEIKILETNLGYGKYDLNLLLQEGKDSVTGFLVFNGDYYNEPTIERFIAHYINLLENILENGTREISDLYFLTGEEKNQLLFKFNDLETGFPRDKTIHQLFEEQVERTPNHVAVVGPSIFPGTIRRFSSHQFPLNISYKELNEKSDRLAYFLREKGVGSDTIVGILVERSIEMIPAIMGVLKAGGAYMPIDPDYPRERIDFMLEDSGVEILLKNALLTEVIQFSQTTQSHPAARLNQPNHLAYIIYTSGTTGRPKGVMIEHRNVVRLMFNDKFQFDFSSRDIWTMFHSVCFDFSVWEMYGALLYGGKLVLISKSTARDPRHYLKILKEEQVTVLNQTPAAFYNLSEAESQEPGEALNLKYVIFGGEALKPRKLKKWRDRYPGTTLINMFGITETTVHVTYKKLEDRDIGSDISNIGCPIPTLCTYVMDKNLKLAPTGVAGELCVGGDGVARGYLNRPELTAEKFVENSYVPGQRLYRSGDLGRISQYNELEYLGRIDHQVKIRGFRIELGEIENRLLSYEPVKEAVVLAEEDDAGNKRIAAYVIPDLLYGHTILQLLRLEKEGRLHDKSRYELPNGCPIFYLNRNETDFMYKEIFEQHTYLKHGITLNDGACVFDVGANIGLFSIFVGQECKDAEIYAFEPLPPIYEILKINTSIYGANVKTLEYGISDIEEEALFTFYPHAASLSGRFADEAEDLKRTKVFINNKQLLKKNRDTVADKQVNEFLEDRLSGIPFKCRLKTISQLIRENVIERIDLLKIDVEKGELDVLNGIDEQDWSRIRQLVIEVHDIDGQLEKILNILNRHNYITTVEQDELLEKTDLYNVYALSPRKGPETIPVSGKRKQSQKSRNKNGLSPERFVRGMREYLKEKLPDYMVPSLFFVLDKFPLTSTGKIDRRVLSTLEGMGLGTDTNYIAPRDELEEILAKTWSDVLGVQRIGVNDNFFEVGGDSIKAIQISARLNKSGYGLEIKDIFINPVISELALKIKKIEKIADQSVVEGIVPLTPIQKYFFTHYHISPHHFNQAVMLHAREGMDEEGVRAVFKKIQEHHDALRMVYREESGEIVQMNRGLEHPCSVEMYDLRKCENSAAALTDRCNRIQTGIDLEKGPLMKVGLFHLDDGDRLLIVLHHLVVDGVSWRILFEDIETLYLQYKNGEPLNLPGKTDSFKRWAEGLAQYANSESFLRERTYWAELESKEIPELKKDSPDESNIRIDVETLSFDLDELDTETLLRKVNDAFGTEINDVLLTALGMALKTVFGHNRFLIALEGHGREGILEDIYINRTVGWFTSIFPVLLNVSFESDLSARVKEIKESLHQVPNNGVGYGILKYMTAVERKEGINFKLKPQISFNYLGQFDAELKEMSSFEIAKESAGSVSSPENRREYEFDVSGIVANKRLSISINYNRKHYRPETVESLLNEYRDELIRVINFCSTRRRRELTPSDFTYTGLSIETVDRLQTQYSYLIKDIYPLTPMQEGMLFHSLYSLNLKGSTAYFEQFSYRLRGELNIPIVEKSINELFKRYDILRTVFIHDGLDRPLQVVLKDRAVDFYFEDLRGVLSTKGEMEKFTRDFKERGRQRGFDPGKDVLMRVSVIRLDDTEYEYTWSHHHMLMDGWCVGILIAEYLQIYRSYMENQAYRLPPVRPYRDYIKWLERQDKEETRRYWSAYLEDYEELSGIPGNRPLTGNEEGYSAGIVYLSPGIERTRGLERLAIKNNVTLNVILQAIWGILLGRYNNKQDVVFGMVVSGRPSQLEGIESMIGLFINTIPVRIRFEGGMTFNSLARDIQRAAVEAESHHYCSLAEIQAGCNLKQHLLDHIWVFENFPVTEQIDGAMNQGNEADGKYELTISDAAVFGHTNYDFYMVIEGGDEVKIKFKYNRNRYEEEFIDQIGKHFNRLIEQVINDGEMCIDELTLLADREKVSRFSEDLRDSRVSGTIQERLLESFQKYKNNTAVQSGGVHISYSQLDDLSNCVAGWIIENGTREGSFIGIHIADKIDVISVMIGVLKAGCVFIPLDTGLRRQRIETMVRVTRPGVIFTDDADKCKFFEIDGKPITGFREVVIDDLFYRKNKDRNFTGAAVSYRSEDKIYIYFTSGSTGTPQAIIGKNESLLQFVQWEIDTFEIDSTFRFSQFTAVGFDAFLRDIFTPLCAGAAVCIPPQETAGTDSDAIVKWIDRKRIHLIHCVPSFFKIFTLGDLTGQNFRDLKYILLSGEEIKPLALEKWYEIFGDRIQLVNLFGPTETTLVRTFYRIRKNDVFRHRIPIGKPMRGCRIILLDKNMNICPRGIIGEIYIRTPYRTHGYHNNPQLNQEKFIVNPFGSDPGDLIYKTGDLGRELIDGSFEFTGRIDRQVKIRGGRVEVGEIETVLLKYKDIREVVVTAQEKADGELHLCAYFVSGSEYPASELRGCLAKYLPDYMIPSYFVRIEKMPLSPNGKVELKALPVPVVEPCDNHNRPGNALEEKIAELWSEVLSVEKETIGRDANFFELGGHSLKVTAAIAKIHKALNAKVSVAYFFENPTVRELAEYIEGLPQQRYARIEPVEKKDYYPLSSSQSRLFFLQRLSPESTSYNISQIVGVEGTLEPGRLKDAFNKLIIRHKSLGTFFGTVDEKPVQRVCDKVVFRLDYYEPERPGSNREGGGNEDKIIRDYIRPFDLGTGPLIRAGIIKIENEMHILMVDMHHIITDGISMNILYRDFMDLYAGKELSPLTLQYSDFSEWENKPAQKEAIKRQEDYWMKELGGVLPVLELPADFPRPEKWNFEGGRYSFGIDEKETGVLRELSLREGATMHILLLAIYTVFLSKLSDREDIIVGMAIANRRHADMENIIGLFLNMLAIRNFPRGEKSFNEFFREVRLRTVNAYDNQDYRFDDLVDKLKGNVNREMNRHPLFNVAFGLQNMDRTGIEMPGLKLLPHGTKPSTSKIDLLMIGVETRDALTLVFEYNLGLFKEKTIVQFSTFFKRVVAAVVENPGIRLKEINLVTGEEIERVLEKKKKDEDALSIDFDI